MEKCEGCEKEGGEKGEGGQDEPFDGDGVKSSVMSIISFILQ